MSGVIHYDFLHDRGLIPCVIGRSMMAHSIGNILAQQSICEHHVLEDLLDRDQDWFDQRQFIVLVSDVSFKIKLVDFLKQKNAHFFSLVNQYNCISPDTVIGQGSYIGGFNSMEVNSVEIGDHVIIGTHNTFGHHCRIGDHCHISHHGFFGFCEIGQGTVVGSQVIIVPPSKMLNTNIEIADYSNILSQSLITHSLSGTGTFYSKRRVSADTSLDQRIL